MKIALFLILCSGVAESCLEPHKFNVYDSFYDCMSAGYQESFNKNSQNISTLFRGKNVFHFCI